jgi:hypothetical protein
MELKTNSSGIPMRQHGNDRAEWKGIGLMDMAHFGAPPPVLMNGQIFANRYRWSCRSEEASPLAAGFRHLQLTSQIRVKLLGYHIYTWNWLQSCGHFSVKQQNSAQVFNHEWKNTNALREGQIRIRYSWRRTGNSWTDWSTQNSCCPGSVVHMGYERMAEFPCGFSKHA